MNNITCQTQTAENVFCFVIIHREVHAAAYLRDRRQVLLLILSEVKQTK